MRIGELARRVGVSTDTVRFYERAGWMPRPARQRENDYRDYTAADADHLRLLLDLRRLDLPLDEAARIAGWCHSGHCGETTTALPALIADRRADIADRMRRLAELDARLADLEGHLRGRRPMLTVLGSGPCCDAAAAVVGTSEGGCNCCAAADQ